MNIIIFMIALFSVMTFVSSCETTTEYSLSKPIINYSQLNKNKVIKFITTDESWDALLDVAYGAEVVYHHISDTPIEELKAKHDIVGEMVTIVRDKYRRFKSFQLSNIDLYSETVEKRNVAFMKHQVEGAINLKSGLKIYYDFYKYDHSYINSSEAMGRITTIVSSRGKEIFDVISGRFYNEFAYIVAGDQISIEDLIVTIKR